MVYVSLYMFIPFGMKELGMDIADITAEIKSMS